MAETRYLGRTTDADGVSYDCFVGTADDCPDGFNPPPEFLRALGTMIATAKPGEPGYWRPSPESFKPIPTETVVYKWGSDGEVQ